jgi:hypothetical protein
MKPSFELVEKSRIKRYPASYVLYGDNFETKVDSKLRV